MPHPKILASLRSADLARLDEEIDALEAAGVDGFHFDVMDGRFVPESCFDPAVVSRVRERTQRLLDVHLLASDPALLASAYAEAGADRISVHVEVVDDLGPLLDALGAMDVAAGLVLLPSTPIERVLPWLDRIALVNPLGVDPTQGLGFQEVTFERVARLVRERDARSARRFVVQADGGVWAKTRDALVEAGADELVGGYPIFSSPDYAAAVRALREG